MGKLADRIFFGVQGPRGLGLGCRSLCLAFIRRPRPAGRAPGKPSVPFLGTFRESGELLCICDIACCFSRLGSLTTVLTWLRSRACAGMQGWALCVCVQTGFTQHGFHLVTVACMCRDAGIGSVSVGSCCTLWLRGSCRL